MRRRELLALAAGWPLAARAQQPAVPVVGWLSGRSLDSVAPLLVHFGAGLSEAGLVEGTHYRLEPRWAEGHYERLPDLAADLVDRKVDLIVATGGGVAALAAKAATTSIPTVFVVGVDPVRSGLVSSLNRPGGNLTGIVLLISELGAKRLDLLRELVPSARRVAVLAHAQNAGSLVEAREVMARATGLGLEAILASSASEADLAAAFAAMAERKVEGLVVCNDAALIDMRERLVGLTAKHRLPTIHFTRDFVDAGGLVSYGASLGDAYQKAGVYAGQVLKGVRPTDLPVLRPSRLELLVNLKTARDLGLAIPPAVLARADEVIE